MQKESSAQASPCKYIAPPPLSPLWYLFVVKHGNWVTYQPQAEHQGNSKEIWPLDMRHAGSIAYEYALMPMKQFYSDQ